MTFTVMLDRTYYAEKPSNDDAAIMVGRRKLKRTTLTLEELANDLAQGATFRTAVIKDNGSKDEDWIYNQLFAIDFDHNCTIEGKLAKSRELGIPPCFGYTSFNHTDEDHRFRLVFAVREPITDRDKRDRFQNALCNAFGDFDKKCLNAARIFYGGRKVIHADYEARIDNIDGIIEAYYKEVPNEKVNKPRGKLKENTTNDFNVIPYAKYSPKIEAIRALDAVKMRRLLLSDNNAEGIYGSDKIDISCNLSITTQNSQEPIICRNQMQLYRVINHIDLEEFTGLSGMVNCVLPNHNDRTPSAHIYRTDADHGSTHVYKCFGCGRSRPIISFVEELAGCSKTKAINFIKQVYDIRFDFTERIREQQQAMIDSANFLDTEEFKVVFPNLAKLMRTRKHHLQKLLLHFVQYVTDDGIELDGKLLFWGSYPVLMEVCGINSNPTTLSQSLIYFTLCNLLVKVPHETLPPDMYAKARAIAAKHNLKKLTNFYQFEEYGIATLSDAEEIAKNLIENNVSIAGISREYVLRTFGVELANKVFPQYKFENERGTSEKSDAKTFELSKTVVSQIQDKGYCLERDIFSSRSDYSQWKTSIAEILDTYGLARLRLNKEIKERYGVVCNGYPSIVVQRDSA